MKNIELRKQLRLWKRAAKQSRANYQSVLSDNVELMRRNSGLTQQIYRMRVAAKAIAES